jgi:hypothetical protein
VLLVSLGLHGFGDAAAIRAMSRRGEDGGNARRSRVSAVDGWTVRYHPSAGVEADAAPAQERKAIDNAVDKLVSLGPLLPFPHSSKVMGDPGGALRELRPRAGRSPWRCIYGRIGDVFVIAAVGPEAQKDKPGFERAVATAKTRLAEVEP